MLKTIDGIEVPDGDVVYLLHFERPYRHAAHYSGTTNKLRRRLTQHRSGIATKSSRLVAAAHEAGIGFKLARIWLGGYARERQLKRQGSFVPRCSICKESRKNNGGMQEMRRDLRPSELLYLHGADGLRSVSNEGVLE